MSPVSTDAYYIAKANELAHMKEEREKTKPSLYVLLAIVLGIVALVSGLSLLGALAGLFSLASLFTAATVLKKKGELGDKINKLTRELQSVQASKPVEAAVGFNSEPVQSSIVEKFAELKKLLDADLITQEEFDKKKAEILMNL